MVLACFVLSGFSGLVLETAWTQQLTLVFGSTELAVMTVLAAYMAGLTLGAAVAGRYSSRIRRPVRVYAFLELGIGVSALLVAPAIAAATRLYVLLWGRAEIPTDSRSFWQVLFYLVASFMILAVPTGCLGATLPVLVRHAVREDEQIGPRVGVLYAANTFGAAAGALLSANALLPLLGLGRSVQLAAVANISIFAVASRVARGSPGCPLDTVGSPAARHRERHWMLALVLVSGFVSFSYEVLWTRLLTNVLGGSLYAFGVMLASFLVGLALGSALASRLATTGERAGFFFALSQLGVAGSSLAALFSANALADVFGGAGPAGSLLHGASLGGLTLLPGAVCMGAAFTFAVRVVADEAASAGRASALVYAWSTVGGVGGAMACGLVLLPVLRFEGAFAFTASLSLATAAAAALLSRRRRWAIAAAAAVGLALLALLPVPIPWSLLRSSPLGRQNLRGEVVTYSVGRTATVLLMSQGDRWRLTCNGLPESIIGSRGAVPGGSDVAHWMSLLPLAVRPATTSLLVVGLGAGNTVERVPEAYREIHVVELEEEVVEANRMLAPERPRDPLADPRLVLHLNDARNALLLSRQQFDAIVSQPSHPWTAGSSQLYTREFFGLVGDRLRPGGVFVQWIGLGFVDRALLRSLMATLLDVFPYLEVYRPPPGGGVLLVASSQPMQLERTAARALEMARPEWARLGVHAVEDILVARVLDSAGAERESAGGRITTDARNLLQTRSPRVTGNALSEAADDRLLDGADPLLREDFAGDRLYVVARLLRLGQRLRARRVAARIADPVRRLAAQALIADESDRARKVAVTLGRVVQQGPTDDAALQTLLLVGRHRISALPKQLGQLLMSRPVTAAVLQGWRLQASGQVTLVRGLETELARVGVTSPLFLEAIRLRVLWRIAQGDAGLAAEALDLCDTYLNTPWLAGDLLLRARAARGANENEKVAGSIYELARLCRRTKHGCPELRQALRLVAGSDDAELEAARAYAERRYGSRRAAEGW